MRTETKPSIAQLLFALLFLLIAAPCTTPERSAGLSRDMPILYSLVPQADSASAGSPQGRLRASVRNVKGRTTIGVGTKIDFGDRVETSARVGAVVLFPDGSSLRLAPDTEWELLDGRNSIFWMRLRRGAARLVVAPWGWREGDPEHNRSLQDQRLTGNQAFRLRYVLQTPWATLGVRTETRFVEAVARILKREKKWTIFTHLDEKSEPAAPPSSRPESVPTPGASDSLDLSWDIRDVEKVEVKGLEGTLEVARDEMSLITIGGRKLRRGEGLDATQVRLGDTRAFGIQEFQSSLPTGLVTETPPTFHK